MPDFTETMPEGYGQQFRIDELLYEAKTDHQHLMFFQNVVFGRVMVLDGIVQTTEKDEFIYHEMMAHVPILAHGHARRVLIVGGGDGGLLREVTRHRQVAHVTQVEIDAQVIDLCRRYLPNHSQGAFDDPRVDIVIDDGLGFVRQTDSRFDVILSDSTDPIGPGEVLFQEDFYAACRRCLAPGGILVTQNGVPFLQPDEIQATARRIRRVFDDWHFYSAAVPAYTGGIMTFAWGTDDKALRYTDIEVLRSRYTAADINTRYYTPEVHAASFALPQYILEAIGKA
jgi:spermidine synthase